VPDSIEPSTKEEGPEPPSRPFAPPLPPEPSGPPLPAPPASRFAPRSSVAWASLMSLSLSLPPSAARWAARPPQPVAATSVVASRAKRRVMSGGTRSKPRCIRTKAKYIRSLQSKSLGGPSTQPSLSREYLPRATAHL